MSTYRFNHNGIKGEIKPASSEDNPGELMILSMPLASNVDMSEKRGLLTICPLCAGSCWASPQIPAAAQMFQGRVIAACTQCALSANMNKGSIPRFLQERNLTPEGMRLRLKPHGWVISG
ncbi:hypothetical protein BC351_14745 [Paenibacillus ferrarius]|uniref:Uncharacterized protein n=1 Tax=Paenibacillus ferrarius TaxID=1469647 RepID=A0A1V4HR85_9BACL|nr:hypothetical protein [Paenibacillus ferrarius]OPH61203.1 hypothetical protein BC351_14745 [Paenibacillus ferrarius]